MANNQKGDFTLEEILAEQREKKQSRGTQSVASNSNKEVKQPVKTAKPAEEMPKKVITLPNNADRPMQKKTVPPASPVKNTEQNVSKPQDNIKKAENKLEKKANMPQPNTNKTEPKGKPVKNTDKKLPETAVVNNKQQPKPLQKPDNQVEPKQKPAKKSKKQKAPKPANPQGEIISANNDGATEDLNLYATGNIKSADLEKPKKKKKGGLFGWFGKKKKVPDYDESDDMFYGLQLKPIDEYRKGFNTGEIPVKDTFAVLFDESKEEIDDDVAENFRKLEKQRRNRVEEAMKSSGMNESEIESELGFVAPMPVSSFAADPYTKQKGTNIEGMSSSTGEIPDFQKAQLDSLKNSDQTMQFKLNVLNDTIEIASLKDLDSPVSEKSVDKILSSAPENAEAFLDDATKVIPKITESAIAETADNKPLVKPQNNVGKPVVKPNISQTSQNPNNDKPVVVSQNRAEKPVVNPNVPQASQNPNNDKPVVVPQNRAEKPVVKPNVPQASQNPNNGKPVVVPQNRAEKPVIKPNVPQASQNPNNDKPVVSQNRAEKSVVKPNISQNITTSNNAPNPLPKNKAVAPSIPTNNTQNLEDAILNDLKNKDALVAENTADASAVSQKKSAPKKTKKASSKSINPVQQKTEVSTKLPQVDSPFEYREKGVPMHVLNTDIASVLDFSVSQANVAPKPISSEANNSSTPAVKNSMANRKNKIRELEKNKKIKANQNVDSYENPESIDDYTNPDDGYSIAAEMKRDMRDLTIRMMITGAVTLILILLNVFLGGKLAEDTGNSAIIYAGLTFVFLAGAVVGCFRTILNGLKAMFTFNANSDSAVSVAAVAAMLQAIFAMFMKTSLSDGSLSLYAAVVSGLLFVNAAGKLTMLRRIHSNFRFVTSREQKYAVSILNNYGLASKMTKDMISGKPVVAYQVKTGFLRRFLEISYRPDPCEVSSQMLAPVGLIASLVLCIICMVITKNVPMAVNSFTAGLIVSVCAGNMIAINLPISRLAKLARRAGAMVSGYESVRLAGDVNAVVLDAEELFPKGTVVLDGIKTYAPRSNVEEAIMCASALVNKVGGTLSGVFEQVIMEKEDHLPDVSHYSYEDEAGLIGMVDGKITYIGNRALLIKHKIDLPPREDEAPYTAANKHMVYIAQDNNVIAMLVMSYTADRRRKNELHRMEDSGISIVIKTNDPNVTPQFVGRLFSIDPHSVSILDDSIAQTYNELTDKEVPRSDATIATKGRIESLMTVLGACVSSKRDANLIVALQNIGAVLGFLLVAFLSCFGAISRLTVLPLFLFELAWLLIMIIVPRMRKP